MSASLAALVVALPAVMIIPLTPPAALPPAVVGRAVQDSIPEVGGTLVPETIGVGESAVLRVSVETRGGTAPAIRLPALPPGLVTRGSHTSTALRGGAGGQRTVVVQELMLEALRPGVYELGTAEVRIGGVVWQAGPFRLQVTDRPATPPAEPGRDPGVHLRLYVAPDTIYVGQEVRLRAEALFAGDLRIRQARPAVFEPPAAAGFWSYDLPRPSQPVVRQESGRRYEAELWLRSYFPLQPGTFALDGARLTYEVRRGFLGDPLPGQATAPSARVHVLPLPDEGRPAEFAGAVGRFSLAARVMPTRVAAGETAELLVEVTGVGNLKALPPPALPRLPGVEVHVLGEETQLDLTGAEVRGRKRFRWALVPVVPGTVTVPPVRLPHFDPAAGRWAEVTGDTLRLTVSAGANVPGTLPAPHATPAPAPLRWVGGRWFLAAQIVPLLLVAGALLARGRRRRSRRAAPDRIRRVAGATSLGDVERALREALAAWVGAGAARGAPEEVAVGLRDAGVATREGDEIAGVLEELARARFAPPGHRADGEVAGVAARAAAALAALGPPPSAPSLYPAASKFGCVLMAVLACSGAVSVQGAPTAGMPPAAPAVEADGASFDGGLDALRDGAWGEAAAAFGAHLARHPDDAGAWYNLGLAAAQDGRHGAAVHAWVRSARLAPRLEAPRAALRTEGARAALALAGPPGPVRPAELVLVGAFLWWAACILAAAAALRYRRAVPWAAASLAAAGVAVLLAWVLRPPAHARVSLRSSPVHAAPDTRAQVLGTVPGGVAVRVAARRPGWLLVEVPSGLEGWVEEADAPPLEGPPVRSLTAAGAAVTAAGVPSSIGRLVSDATVPSDRPPVPGTAAPAA